MSASAKSSLLIIGIGNPLRSDDRLGWAMAEQLARDYDGACDLLTVHQLTPELAQEMAAATLVVLIDASREGEPGEFHVRPLSLSAQSGAVGAHHMAPEELAALTAAVYGRCPPVVIASMTGADFSMGEHLSPVVAQRIPLMISALVIQLREKADAT